MKITPDVLVAGTGCSRQLAIVWTPLIQAALDKFGINDVNSVAAFLANAGVETGGLSSLEESLNYTAIRMAAVWPTRYALPQTPAEVASKTARKPNALALSLAGKPVAFANNVYANRLGNGAPETNDGWNFRGGGLFQLTGRANYTRCAAAIGIDVVTNPDALRTPDAAAAMSAAWFFVDKGCATPAAAGNFSRVVLLINGALPNEANHGALRLSRYTAAKSALGA